jgi:hypothetical protein
MGNSSVTWGRLEGTTAKLFGLTMPQKLSEVPNTQCRAPMDWVASMRFFGATVCAVEASKAVTATRRISNLLTWLQHASLFRLPPPPSFL